MSGIVLFRFSNRSESNFPFHIYNGSLIDYKNETRVAYIWNQGFNLTITNEPDIISSSLKYQIFIFNIHSKNLAVSNLNDNEFFSILNDTCVSLILESNPNEYRVIKLLVSISNENFKIAAIGDTQGFQQIYRDLINTTKYSFILHLGDISPFGDLTQLNIFQNISKYSKVPIFSTPGNHDIKQSNSTKEYEPVFGKSEYYFKFSEYIFISLDSSRGYFLEKSFNFLNKILVKYPQSPKIIFTHIPLIDPREGRDHSLINKTQASRILSMINGQNIVLMISGHIHYYNVSIIDGIHFVISGGGGASLHEPNTRGGFHHIVEIEFPTEISNLSFNPIIMQRDENANDIKIIKDNHEYFYSLSDLQLEFEHHIGKSSFQNIYQNWRCYGIYVGVSIQDLLETVGGISLNQILEIEARDGLKENYSYSVIYPNDSWKLIQGVAILAFSFNNTFVPDWSDGYRIVFLTPDEAYSNEDCRETSPIGEGYWIYPSAGYRWLKYVKTLTILGG